MGFCLFCVCLFCFVFVGFVLAGFGFCLFVFDECYKTQGIMNKIWKNTGNKTEPVKIPLKPNSIFINGSTTIYYH